MPFHALEKSLDRLRRGAWLQPVSALGAFVVIGALAAMVAFLLLQALPLAAPPTVRSAEQLALSDVRAAFATAQGSLLVEGSGRVSDWPDDGPAAIARCQLPLAPAEAWLSRRADTLWLSAGDGTTLQVRLKDCRTQVLPALAPPWAATVVDNRLLRSRGDLDLVETKAGLLALRVAAGKLVLVQGARLDRLREVASVAFANVNRASFNAVGEHVLVDSGDAISLLRVVRAHSGEVSLLITRRFSADGARAEFVDENTVALTAAPASVTLVDAQSGGHIGKLNLTGTIGAIRIGSDQRWLVSTSTGLTRLTLAPLHGAATWRSLWLPVPRLDGAGSAWAWTPEGPSDGNARFALVPLLGTTLLLALLGLLVAVPVAFMLAAFAALNGASLRTPIKQAVELIEAIPSILIALCVLIYLAPLTNGEPFSAALLLSVALGIVLVPTVFSIADEALHAVPRSFAESALALGARPLQAFVALTLPAAASGLIGAVCLGFGRAISETMLLLLLASMLQVSALGWLPSPLPLGATLASELPEVPFGSTHFRVLFVAALLLLGMSLLINVFADRFRARFRRKLGQL